MALVKDNETRDESEARLQILLQASELLGQSLDFDRTLANVATLLVPRMADGYVVDLVEEDGAIRRVAAIDHDPAKASLMERLKNLGALNPKAPSGIQRILEAGVPVLNERVTGETLAAGARDADHLAMLQTLGMYSGLIVPLKARGRAIGLLWLYFSASQRTYVKGDLAFSEAIAARAALAIDNARLFRERGEAVKAREDFLAIASHELRTPVTSLMLRVQSIARRIAHDETYAPSRDEVVAWSSGLSQQMTRMSRLVEEMLDVSRITRSYREGEKLDLRRERFDLGAALSDVVAGVEEERRRKNCIITLDVEDAIEGTWDRMRIEQVFQNVLSNAMKYGEGKPITISLARETSAGETGRAVVRIRDQGIGIAAEHLTRIFDQFERMVSARNYGGFGLGLWIARQIVQSSGGTIRAESTLGQGATFIVELPISL